MAGHDRMEQQAYKRAAWFEVLPDGTHQHRLKDYKQQENLSRRLSQLLGGKEKNKYPAEDDLALHLSLHENDRLTIDREKRGITMQSKPIVAASLREKY